MQAFVCEPCGIADEVSRDLKTNLPAVIKNVAWNPHREISTLQRRDITSDFEGICDNGVGK